MMKTIDVFTTCRDTDDRLTEKEPVPFSTDKPDIEQQLINIHPDVTFQTVEGFGGAFTEAGAVTLAKMSPQKRSEIIAFRSLEARRRRLQPEEVE